MLSLNNFTVALKFNGNKEMNSSQTHLLQTSSIILQVFRMSNDSQRQPIFMKFSNFKMQFFKLPIKNDEVHDRSAMISIIFKGFHHVIMIV